MKTKKITYNDGYGMKTSIELARGCTWTEALDAFLFLLQGPGGYHIKRDESLGTSLIEWAENTNAIRDGKGE